MFPAVFFGARFYPPAYFGEVGATSTGPNSLDGITTVLMMMGLGH